MDSKKKIKSITAPTKREAEYLAHRFLTERKEESALTIKKAIAEYIDSRRAIFSPSTTRGYVSLQRSAYGAIEKTGISQNAAKPHK